MKLQELGDKIADAMTNFSGSWRFLFAHAGWWLLWMAFIEIPPFGVLTLIVSLEAIILSTLVLMSQNRAAKRDVEQAKLDRKHMKAEEKHREETAQHHEQVLSEVKTLAQEIQKHLH